MNISFYMPFKPLDHPNPSGDLVTGTELYNRLRGQGHSVSLASKVRCRWAYYKPLTLLQLLKERHRITQSKNNSRVDIWLSYHCYYKAPDLLGPTCANHLKVPYTIFQGIYSTKRRKKLLTLPGFYLNKRCLLSARHIFTNKKRDLKNLRRIIDESRLSYIAPGINPDNFCFDATMRKQFRRWLHCADETVIMSAAMMRPGVKKEGIEAVIDACRVLADKGHRIKLIIAGDGQCRRALEQKAQAALHPFLDVKFLGLVPREQLYKYYSCADIFVFPGVEESLGMVYLEAQACGLPVVAYNDWGGGEAIQHGRTGLTSSFEEKGKFIDNIEHLILNRELRLQLASNGRKYIRRHHDLGINYKKVEDILKNLIASWEIT